MKTTTEDAPRRDRILGRLGGAALAVLVAVAGPDAPAGAQEEAGDRIQRDEPLARVGITQRFTATLDSAPSAANWDLFRKTLAVRYEPGKSEKLDAATRKHLVLHAAVIEGGEIREHHTSEPAELLPGATKLEPDAFLPERSMVPEGYRISNLMALGEIEVQPGEIMTDLVRDIIADMTRDTPVLYVAATPPEEQVGGPHKIHPIVVQLAPTDRGGGSGT